MFDKTIPAGYSLAITTSENDYDNVCTNYLHGLPGADVRFYLAVLSFFRDGCNDSSRFGNTEPDPVKEAHAITEAVNSCPPESWGNQLAIKDYEAGRGGDLINELVGLWGDGSFYRVFEGFEVFEVPVEIQPLANVTELFRNVRS